MVRILAGQDSPALCLHWGRTASRRYLRTLMIGENALNRPGNNLIGVDGVPRERARSEDLDNFWCGVNRGGSFRCGSAPEGSAPGCSVGSVKWQVRVDTS